MENKIDLSKKYRTREGHEVILHTVDGLGTLCVFGSIKNPDGNYYTETWSLDGKAYIDRAGSELDLIEVKEKIKLTGWLVVIFKKAGGYFSVFYLSKEDALREINKQNLHEHALIDLSKYNIEFEEGDGL